MSELPVPPAARAFEVKEKLGGAVQRFPLERWLRSRDLFVGRWVAAPDNDFGAPAGVTSWGVWWRARPYGAYRIHDPEGRLLLYRLDAVDRVRIGTEGVQYRDLLLDALIRPRDGRVDVRLDDEDEVEEAVASGLLDAHAARRVRWTRELFLRRPEAITRRVDAAITLAVETVRGSS